MAGSFLVRWSPHSTEDLDTQRFVRLRYNGRDHDLSYYSVLSTKHEELKFKLLARHPKIPNARCLDWSPVDPDLIAIGSTNGEAALLRPSDPTLSPIPLPIKQQRSCNEISFNSSGTMVATGLDKVRNDFCLTIWDVKERLSHSHKDLNPIRKLATSEAISSLKFTRDNPSTIIAAAGNKFLRLYDLRESPNNPALNVHTRYVYNITMDVDPNYFASNSDDGVVAVWDRRAARADPTVGPVLQLGSMIEEFGRAAGMITSLRYSPTRVGLLAVSCSSGIVRVWETAKLSDQDGNTGTPTPVDVGGAEVHKPRGVSGWRDSAASLLDTAGRAYGGTSTSGTRTPNHRIYDSQETLMVQRQSNLASPEKGKIDPDKRINSFDWIIDGTAGHSAPAKLLCTMGSEGAMRVLKCPGPVPSIAWGSSNQFAITAENALMILPAPDTKKMQVENHDARDWRESSGKTNASSISDDEFDDSMSMGGSPDQRLGLLEKRRRFRSNSIVRPEDFYMEPATLLRNDVSVTMRRRVEAGYEMKCKKNAALAKKEDRYLEDMWVWLDGADECARERGMMSGLLDLSYLGVNAIWRADRDPVPESRKLTSIPLRQIDWTTTIETINRRASYKSFVNCATDYPEQRRLCLAICGWNFEGDELTNELNRLTKKGLYTKAAGYALFHGDIDRAITYLQRGGQQLKILAAAVAGHIAESKSNIRNSTWKTLASEMATELDDPYLRAIFAYVANSEWEEVLDQIGLPLTERIGIALRWLQDEKLTNFLEEATRGVIENGDLDGIMLTGVTEKAVELLQVYINRTADVQTAALVASFAVPRYFRDERVEYWIESYRNLLNSWRLFHARARFDVARSKSSRDRNGTMILEAPQKQVYVRCANCDKSISHSAARISQKKAAMAAAATAGGRAVPQREAQAVAAAAAGRNGLAGPKLTVCPHCKKSLPRCAVCLLYLGTIYYKPGQVVEGDGGTGEGGKGKAERDYDRWFNFCLSCNHGMHAGHAKEWFASHRICPVPECECACKM